ncbi:hypothetical protein BKA62DRAFT_353858 [Auriculariales sp. MPI-PUGE-AT-0066]|nr:hypothetical protein BKA62DRAFT_353858 [Auriculariales sp. MPI-PUGE-AT-0066]
MTRVPSVCCALTRGCPNGMNMYKSTLPGELATVKGGLPDAQSAAPSASAGKPFRNAARQICHDGSEQGSISLPLHLRILSEYIKAYLCFCLSLRGRAKVAKHANRWGSPDMEDPLDPVWVAGTRYKCPDLQQPRLGHTHVAMSRTSPSPHPDFKNNDRVVDHDAPHVTEDTGAHATLGRMGMRGAAAGGDDRIITVQPLRRSEMQPSYAQDMGLGEVKHGVYGSMLNALGSVIGCLGAVPCLPCPNPFRSVDQGSVGLISRFGQFYKAADPGLVQVNVCTESIRIVDVKIQICSIGRQTVITRDNVNVEIDSVIYYAITNPYRAAFGISDLQKALVERSQTTLRHVVGARAVQSVVTEREAIAFEIAEIVGDIADKWGVAIEGILIKDIIFSPEVAASLSSAAQSKRVGEAKVIAARAEVDAARLMRQAADILASPAAMQIRQLEALQAMAKTAGTKVVFVPMQLQSDVIGQMAGQQQQQQQYIGETAGAGSHADGMTGAARAGMLASISGV